MRFTYITDGSKISTKTGQYIVKGQNDGGLILVDIYEADDDGNLVLVGTEYTAKEDIAKEMKRVDGHNRTLIYDKYLRA